LQPLFMRVTPGVADLLDVHRVLAPQRSVRQVACTSCLNDRGVQSNGHHFAECDGLGSEADRFHCSLPELEL
jgi:hypothetical protein